MTFVPYNPKNLHHKKVNIAEFFRDSLPLLGIHEILARKGWEKILVGPYVKTYKNITRTPYRENAIIILSPRAHSRLKTIDGTRCQDYFGQLISSKTALVIFAQCVTLPDPMKIIFKHHCLSAAFSALHENVLESRIKAIIQEKIRRNVTVHGVVLEHVGRGILITGPSGLGKTTAALQVVSEGCRWIADDRAVIKKNKADKLIISGHSHIQEYLHTDKSGIVAINRIFNKSQIKKRSVLTAIIDVIRTKAEEVSCQFVEKKIMDERLPCLRINISGTGYLDKNMLIKAIQELERCG